GPHIQPLSVQGRENSSPDNVGDKQEHYLVRAFFFVFLSKEISEQGKPGQDGNTIRIQRSLLFQNASEQVDFSILQLNFMIHGALADNWLRDAADGLVSGFVGNFQSNFQAHFTVLLNARSDVNLHAHIDVLKLSVDAQLI